MLKPEIKVQKLFATYFKLLNLLLCVNLNEKSERRKKICKRIRQELFLFLEIRKIAKIHYFVISNSLNVFLKKIKLNFYFFKYLYNSIFYKYWVIVKEKIFGILFNIWLSQTFCIILIYFGYEDSFEVFHVFFFMYICYTISVVMFILYSKSRKVFNYIITFLVGCLYLTLYYHHVDYYTAKLYLNFPETCHKIELFTRMPPLTENTNSPWFIKSLEFFAWYDGMVDPIYNLFKPKK